MAEKKAEARTQWTVYMPPDTAREVDAHVGSSSRNAWIIAAITEKLARERAESGQVTE